MALSPRELKQTTRGEDRGFTRVLPDPNTVAEEEVPRVADKGGGVLLDLAQTSHRGPAVSYLLHLVTSFLSLAHQGNLPVQTAVVVAECSPAIRQLLDTGRSDTDTSSRLDCPASPYTFSLLGMHFN
jgi:hypothetical protein